MIAVDLFAGGGGASLGMELAGATVAHAVNHWPAALSVHERNHRETTHHLESVWRVKPVEAPPDVLWASPDCTHFSRAKGGKPRQQGIRSLAWSVVRWAAASKPRVIIVENVPEFQQWGPLDADGHPVAARRGKTFRAWARKLERLGYQVEWRVLAACDYGAPTTRRRLYVVARRDRAPRWPTPTHGPGSAHPWRTAAEVIDWSLPIPSIFDRKKPLAEATMRRIARGIRKFVIEANQPFLLHLTHGGRLHPMDAPIPTVTSANRGELALISPSLIHVSNGERPGQAPRIYDIEAPLGTVVAGGIKQGLVAAYLARHFGGRGTDGSAMSDPVRTVTAQDHHALVATFLARYQGTGEAEPLTRPIGTLTARDRYSLIGAFLTRYQGTSTGSEMSAPVPTVTGGGEHLGLVTVIIGGAPYAIVDIGMRMLTPRELARAQGFPDSYVIATGHDGRRITNTDQVRLIGNSVCPPVARALLEVNR